MHNHFRCVSNFFLSLSPPKPSLPLSIHMYWGKIRYSLGNILGCRGNGLEPRPLWIKLNIWVSVSSLCSQRNILTDPNLLCPYTCIWGKIRYSLSRCVSMLLYYVEKSSRISRIAGFFWSRAGGVGRGKCRAEWKSINTYSSTQWGKPTAWRSEVTLYLLIPVPYYDSQAHGSIAYVLFTESCYWDERQS